jgi:hypothetical protein
MDEVSGVIDEDDAHRPPFETAYGYSNTWLFVVKEIYPQLIAWSQWVA